MPSREGKNFDLYYKFTKFKAAIVTGLGSFYLARFVGDAGIWTGLGA